MPCDSLGTIGCFLQVLLSVCSEHLGLCPSESPDSQVSARSLAERPPFNFTNKLSILAVPCTLWPGLLFSPSGAAGNGKRGWENVDRWRGKGGKEHKSGGMVAGSRRQMATGKTIPESLTRVVPANKAVLPPLGGSY